jgi:2-oxo-hept-3-ene-1,7-dioate hydratase
MRAQARCWVGIILSFPLLAHAECPDGAAVAAYLADFQAAKVSTALGANLTLAEAECARGRLVKELPRVLGRVVGYKAGFTNPEVQKRVGVEGPAWGVMFEKTMLSSGATLSARFGARPHYEADFVAVVKDAGLADARTPLEALKHISAVVPFIELPDLMADGPLNGIDAIARNIAFRGGVLGPLVAVEPTEAFLDALANMTVVLSEDKSHKELGRAEGRVLMGHPVKAALWLAQALEENGIALKAGDLLSLGGYIPLAPAQSGTSISVKYVGLPGDPSVTVRFE